uniref:Uncharacterized protein n=1 Tax=Aegilops tauschii subsp. strangulata TaxID=200361 RepID=A0A453QDP3_AEGTS
RLKRFTGAVSHPSPERRPGVSLRSRGGVREKWRRGGEPVFLPAAGDAEVILSRSRRQRHPVP